MSEAAPWFAAPKDVDIVRGESGEVRGFKVHNTPLREHDIVRAEERIVLGFLIALNPFDTETLLAVAAYRDEIDPDGWYQKIIRDYVEEWR